MWTGADIQQLRIRLGWTTDQLAQALGINSVTVWRWERSYAPPVPDWQRIILDRLVVYADEWEAHQRAQQEAAAKRQSSGAGEVLAGMLIAGGLLGLAAALFAEGVDKGKKRTRRGTKKK